MTSAQEGSDDADLIRTIANHGLLDCNLNTPDEEEEQVSQEVGEGVQVILLDISAVELVEEAHQNEGVEDESVHLESGSGLIVLIS